MAFHLFFFRVLLLINVNLLATVEVVLQTPLCTKVISRTLLFISNKTLTFVIANKLYFIDVQLWPEKGRRKAVGRFNEAMIVLRAPQWGDFHRCIGFPDLHSCPAEMPLRSKESTSIRNDCVNIKKFERNSRMMPRNLTVQIPVWHLKCWICSRRSKPKEKEEEKNERLNSISNCNNNVSQCSVTIATYFSEM